MKKIFSSRKTGKIILSTLTIFTLSLVSAVTVLACTTFIAGRAVTTDGSRIFGRSNDSDGLDVIKIVRRPAFNKQGPWTFTSAETNFTAQLPARGYSYLALPSAGLKPGYGTWDEAVLNDHQVCLTATESIYANPAALVADPYVKNGIDESVLPTIVIPYVSTALAGVEFLGSLLAQYGSTEGNAVVFADAKETWYMEIYTGHQWAAIRFPEDRYAVIANDSLLGNLDVTDTANVRTSPNLVKLAREHHFLQENNGQIHMAHTYGAPHRDYSQLRIWAAQKKLSPSQIGAYNVDTTYTLLQKPDHQISLAEAMDLFRYRYEDTAYNANTHPNNRAIGINRTAEAHFFWLRDDKPQTLWVALANPEMSIFLPLYGNVTKMPEAFTLEAATYNKDSAYWKFRSLSALAVQDRTGYGQEVRSTWRKMELDLIKNMPDLDAQYRAAGSTSQAANKLCGDVANKALHTADTLYQKTWTAFMLSTVQDGNSKNATANKDTH